jgi:hypothetical protein
MIVLQSRPVKDYVHARLSKEEAALLEALKRQTGASDSALVKRGLRLVQRDLRRQRSALDLARKSAGKFSGGPTDLSTNAKYLERFGK